MSWPGISPGGGFHNVLMIQQSGETVCCWLIDKEGNASLESAFNHPPGWEPFRVCDVNQDGKQELLWKHEDGSMISTIVIERKTDDCQIRIDIKKFFGAPRSRILNSIRFMIPTAD
ncbi:hypothetical protein QQ054_32360 [Oscillatoria amoena NRMC-F 0135]|nr:hypothetical protein [Oscillatoria amoena NRMC-F 0135]